MARARFGARAGARAGASRLGLGLGLGRGRSLLSVTIVFPTCTDQRPSL